MIKKERPAERVKDRFYEEMRKIDIRNADGSKPVIHASRPCRTSRDWRYRVKTLPEQRHRPWGTSDVEKYRGAYEEAGVAVWHADWVVKRGRW